MTIPALLGVEHISVILGIIGKLQGLAGEYIFAGADHAVKDGALTLHVLGIGFGGSVVGVDQTYLYLLGVQAVHVLGVCKGGEQETLDEVSHHAGNIAEIHGRAQQQNVCVLCLLEDFGQVVLLSAGTVEFAAQQLTCGAAVAALVVKVEEVYHLNLGTGSLCAFQRSLQHFCSVPILAGTSVKSENFHVYILLVVIGFIQPFYNIAPCFTS